MKKETTEVVIRYNNINEQALKHAHQVDNEVADYGSWTFQKINTLNIEEIMDWEKLLEYTHLFWNEVNKTVQEGFYDEKKLGKIIWSEDVFNKYLEYSKHYQIKETTEMTSILEGTRTTRVYSVVKFGDVRHLFNEHRWSNNVTKQYLINTIIREDIYD